MQMAAVIRPEEKLADSVGSAQLPARGQLRRCEAGRRGRLSLGRYLDRRGGSHHGNRRRRPQYRRRATRARACALTQLQFSKWEIGSLDSIAEVLTVNGYVNAAPDSPIRPR